jgi:hypothetical protein
MPEIPSFLSMLNPVSLDDESDQVRLICDVDTGDAERDAGASGMVSVGGGGGGVVDVRVVAVTEFEIPPNTESTFSVPLNETSWKPYCVPGVRLVTVQVFVLPTAVPCNGVEHVPDVTLPACPHEIVGVANLTSYCAGRPVPSFTSVNDSVTEVEFVCDTDRFVTVPGLVTVGGV